MSQTDLYPISIYIIFSRSTLCRIVFSPVGAWLEFSSLELKWDRFGDRDEGTWQKHPENAHNKRSLIRTSHVYHRCRAAGRNQQVEKHKHTHTTIKSSERPTTTFIIFWDFLVFYQISFHHKWNDARLLLMNIVYMSCLTSCWTT